MSENRKENGTPDPGVSQAPGEPPSSTRFGAGVGLGDPGLDRPFGAGARVRVRRLRTRQLGGDRIGDLGTGRLMDSLAAGRPLRVEVHWGPALVTSPVRSIERLGTDRVRVSTVNSAYQVERLAAGEAPLAAGPEGHPSTLGSPAEPEVELVLEEIIEEPEGAATAPSHATGFVSLERLSEPARAPFGAGTRVRVWRCKRTAGERDEVLEALGTGRLLDRVEAGAAVRLAVDGGPTFVTSPLRTLRLLDLHRIEFKTTNSVYRLERLATAASATPPSGQDPSGSR